MKTIVTLLLIYLCFSITAPCADTKVSFAHLTVKDGLPNSTVYYAMQDSKGFIWFCTETGVSRYDGRHFENFTISDGLADNVIFKSYEDSRGRIWFLSYNGRLSYYYKGRIYNSDNMPSLAYQLTGAFLLRCIEDKWHNIWFTNSLSGAVKVNDQGVTNLPPLFADHNHNDFYITAILFAENDSVRRFAIDAENKRLLIQNLQSGKLSLVGPYPDVYRQDERTDNKNFCSEHSTFFITGDDLVSYNGNGQCRLFHPEIYGIQSRIIAFLQEGGYLWLATDAQGVYKIDIAADKVAMHLLSGELVTKMIKDSEDNLWFVTYNNGVFVLKKNAQQVATINDAATFSAGSYTAGNTTYIVSGGEKGSVNIYAEGKLLKSMSLSERQFNRVLDIFPLGEKMMIGSDEGLYEYDTAAKKISKNNCIGSYKNYATGLDGSIWFCSQDRIVKIRDGTCNILTNSLGPLKYTAIAPVSDDVYYIGTINKLYKITDAGKKAAIILTDSILKTQVSSLRMVNGTLWVATHGNGIFLVKNDKVIRHITRKKDDIISDICQRLHDDGTQYIWICTNNGISAIDRNQLTVKYNINTDAGLASNDIKNITTDKTHAYVATGGGMNVFNLADIQSQSAPPQVYITAYKRGNEKIMDPESSIAFKYFKGFINISFTAITFQSAADLQYEYKFETEPEWHKTTVTDVSIFSPEPGTQQLMFRARKYNSAWSNPTILSIIVNPLWYQTIWFKIAVWVTLLLLFVGIVRWRLNAIKEKARAESEHNQHIRELEGRALTSQMNPHFIFNSLNTVQQLILVKDEEQSLNFLTGFSALMRKMLENSRRQYISLQEEIEFLDRYLQLESVRFNHKFAYDLHVDPELSSDEIMIPPVLLQPLLENAIKHGIAAMKEGGVIKLSFFKTGYFLKVIVEDNGVGIDTHVQVQGLKQATKSTAIKVLQERLKLMRSENGEPSTIVFKDKSTDKTGLNGTLIELLIPLTN